MTNVQRAIQHTLAAAELERGAAEGAPAALRRTAELHRRASARLIEAGAAEAMARRDRLQRAFRGDMSGYRKQS